MFEFSAISTSIGPQGPAGLTGPAGPIGPPGVSKSNLFTAVFDQVPVPSERNTSSTSFTALYQHPFTVTSAQNRCRFLVVIGRVQHDLVNTPTYFRLTVSGPGIGTVNLSWLALANTNSWDLKQAVLANFYDNAPVGQCYLGVEWKTDGGIVRIRSDGFGVNSTYFEVDVRY